MNPSENPSETPFGTTTMSVFDKLGRIDSDRLANRGLPPMEGGDIGRVDQNNKKCSKAMTPLPEGFEPGEHDVICGRGRNIWNSIGNINFRRKVESRVDEYSAAATKLDKSAILSSIVAEIRKGSPNGGFVRKDAKTGRWFEVGDFLAREKVSQSFRDVLHDSYRSSNKTKRKRRIEEQAKTAEINSELQRQALEQLQSGQTDKNLYEIICQQQSMLQQPKRQRASPTIREDHLHSDLMLRSDTRLSDMNTVAGYGTLRPSMHDTFGRQHSNRSIQEMHAQSFNDTTFEPLPIRPQETTYHHPGAAFAGQQGMHGMNSVLGSSFGGSGAEEETSNRRMLDSLVSALAHPDQEERYDDPFEPVPLPPADDITKEIEHIFD